MILRAISNFFRQENSKARIKDPILVAHLYKRWRWEVFLSITLGYAFFYTTRLSFSVVKKPLLDAGILDAREMGQIGFALLLSYGVGKTINGFIADHVNPRRFFATGLLMSAVINILSGFSTFFWAFLILWAFNGWFQSVGVPSSGVVMSEWFSNKERGTRYSLWSTAHNIGEAITFTATAFIVTALGWRFGFLAPGFVCLLVAFILYYTMSDRPETHGLPPIADYKRDYSGHNGDHELTIGTLHLQVLKNPYVWLVGIASALMYVARYAINNWGVLYLQIERQYSLVEAAAVVSLFPIVGIAGTILAGPVSDRFFGARRAPVNFVYGILLILSLFVLYFVPNGNPWTVRIAMGVAGFAIGGLLVFLGGLAAMDICSKRTSGAALGFVGGFSYMGAATQDWVSGALIDASRTVVDGKEIYDFTAAKYFWIGAAILSLFLASSLWLAERGYNK